VRIAFTNGGPGCWIVGWKFRYPKVILSQIPVELMYEPGRGGKDSNERTRRTEVKRNWANGSVGPPCPVRFRRIELNTACGLSDRGLRRHFRGRLH